MALWADYHVHTARCGHAVGTADQYVEKALELGLKEICFTDHIPMYWLTKERRDAAIAMSVEQLPDYVREVQQLGSYYTGIKIRLGLEVDFIPGFEAKARGLIKEFPFDYILGSVHYIDGFGFDNPALIEQYRSYDAGQLYRRYFALVQLGAQSKLFDAMAHLDLIKKFNLPPPADIHALYQTAARVLAGAGVSIEINTAGLRAPVGEMYPAPSLLRQCLKHGVPVVLGSDAHAPDQVGFGFDRALGLLEAAGDGHKQ